MIGVTVEEATIGDPTTMKATIAAAVTSLQSVAKEESCDRNLSDRALTEWVADKGYHSNATMKMANEVGLRSCISEPKRGRGRGHDDESERDGIYANRQRLKSTRGRELMRKRGVLLERCFARCLETGGMRRVHLRGRESILKRSSVHVAGFNLSVVMRLAIGVGTAGGLPDGLRGLVAVVCAWVQLGSTSWPVGGDHLPAERAAASIASATASGCEM